MLKAPTVCVVVPVRVPPSKMLDSPEFPFEAVEIEVVPDEPLTFIRALVVTLA